MHGFVASKLNRQIDDIFTGMLHFEKGKMLMESFDPPAQSPAKDIASYIAEQKLHCFSISWMRYINHFPLPPGCNDIQDFIENTFCLLYGFSSWDQLSASLEDTSDPRVNNLISGNFKAKIGTPQLTRALQMQRRKIYSLTGQPVPAPVNTFPSDFLQLGDVEALVLHMHGISRETYSSTLTDVELMTSNIKSKFFSAEPLHLHSPAGYNIVEGLLEVCANAGIAITDKKSLSPLVIKRIAEGSIHYLGDDMMSHPSHLQLEAHRPRPNASTPYISTLWNKYFGLPINYVQGLHDLSCNAEYMLHNLSHYEVFGELVTVWPGGGGFELISDRARHGSCNIRDIEIASIPALFLPHELAKRVRRVVRSIVMGEALSPQGELEYQWLLNISRDTFKKVDEFIDELEKSIPDTCEEPSSGSLNIMTLGSFQAASHYLGKDNQRGIDKLIEMVSAMPKGSAFITEIHENTAFTTIDMLHELVDAAKGNEVKVIIATRGDNKWSSIDRKFFKARIDSKKDLLNLFT